MHTAGNEQRIRQEIGVQVAAQVFARQADVDIAVLLTRRGAREL